MSGTGHFPSIDAEPEQWTADPHRWRRHRPVVLVATAEAVAFAAGWWVDGWIAGGVAATLAALPVLAVAAARYGPEIARRLDGLDTRATRLEQRLAEQHLAITDVSSRQRNHELDEVAARRARKENT